MATKDDVADIFDIRLAVRENVLTREQLAERGITPETLATCITTDGRGWIAEDETGAAGFAVVEPANASLSALFVRPEREQLGHGTGLLDVAVQWLFASGLDRIWLSTGPGTRAHRFYLDRGWKEAGVMGTGDIRLERDRPPDRAHP